MYRSSTFSLQLVLTKSHRVVTSPVLVIYYLRSFTAHLLEGLSLICCSLLQLCFEAHLVSLRSLSVPLSELLLLSQEFLQGVLVCVEAFFIFLKWELETPLAHSIHLEFCLELANFSFDRIHVTR